METIYNLLIIDHHDGFKYRKSEVTSYISKSKGKLYNKLLEEISNLMESISLDKFALRKEYHKTYAAMVWEKDEDVNEEFSGFPMSIFKNEEETLKFIEEVWDELFAGRYVRLCLEYEIKEIQYI